MLALAAGAAALAWLAYHRRPEYAAAVRERAPALHRAATGSWWTFFAERGVGGGVLAFADQIAKRSLDEGAFDRGLLAGTGGILRLLTLRVVRPLHSGHLQAFVFWWVLGTVAVAAYAVAAYWMPRGLS